MNCEQATNLISARLDGEISAAEQAALESHLASCPPCQATADALIAQDADLDTAFTARRSAATALAERVITQLQTQSRMHIAPTTSRTKWANWGRPLLAAAAGFALAVLILRPWDKPAANTNIAATTPVTNPVRQPRPIAQLALATGSVFVCPSNSEDWRPLETGGMLQAGTKVRTGPKARCEFKLNDGSQVRMNAETQMTLAASRQVEVATGQVFSSVQNRENLPPFVVKASPANATVTATSTAFDLACTSTKSVVCTVVEGSVKMEAKGNQDTLRGHETITVDSNGDFGSKKQVQNLMQATQWVDEILVLKGRDDPELNSRINYIFAQIGHDKMWYMHASEVRRLGDHCVIPLVRYIESDISKATQQDEMKRREAARIVGDVATSWAIPELINLLGDTDGDVRYPAAAALQRLTGQSLGRRPEQWRDQDSSACAPTLDQWHTWWQKNKSRYPGADPDAVKPMEIKGKGV